jgi:hypothetical protein
MNSLDPKIILRGFSRNIENSSKAKKMNYVSVDYVHHIEKASLAIILLTASVKVNLRQMHPTYVGAYG